MAQRQLSQAPAFESLMVLERDRIEEQIRALESRRESIDELLQTYQVTAGSLFDEEPEQPRRAARKKTVVTRDKEGALEKIRAVMLNTKGRQLSKDEIKEGVKQLYGVELPSSWEQMLYRKSRKGKIFFKTDEGKFGLLEHRARIETVSKIPETATA